MICDFESTVSWLVPTQHLFHNLCAYTDCIPSQATKQVRDGTLSLNEIMSMLEVHVT
jgi:hypothetical protein